MVLALSGVCLCVTIGYRGQKGERGQIGLGLPGEPGPMGPPGKIVTQVGNILGEKSVLLSLVFDYII